MKKLTCEMCGSTDLMKDGGVFVCQTCGCKYSVEEAKKMMVEGTVEVRGVVQVDDTEKAANYYTLAENAYTANNYPEAESYCNKIIETDPTNYKAWLLKGKAAGWQSSLYKVRIDEASNCFSNAVDNAPENQVAAIKEEATSEITAYAKGLMLMCCNNFAEYPSEENKNEILNKLVLVSQFVLFWLVMCDTDSYDFFDEISHMMNQAAVKAWGQVIVPKYENTKPRLTVHLNHIVEETKACISVISAAIALEEQYCDDEVDSDGEKVNGFINQMYQNLIKLCDNLRQMCTTKFSSSGGVITDIYLDANTQREIIDQMMGYHHKIKERTPDYEIPQRPSLSSGGGCYVATAVYGSYDCPQVWTLRRFRDYTLAETWYGRAFIRTYYAISPTIVKWFGHAAWFKKMWKGKLDRMVANLNAEGVEDTPYEDRNWQH